MAQKSIGSTISANGREIEVLTMPEGYDYLSITDIAKHRNPDEPKIVAANWMRSRNTIEFLGLWELLNNPHFNSIEFDTFKNEAGSNSFTLTPHKWISATNAIGMISKSGRYGGGTFAQSDIAFEFASWVSPEFKLYVIKDYQRLKQDESHRLSLDWNVKRILSKTNYRIHTDAVKENLIPPELSKKQQGYIYANEADLINVALFGETASEWRKTHAGGKGNMRDFASVEQLLVLTNLENLNAYFISIGLQQSERLTLLREKAVEQIDVLSQSAGVDKLKSMHKNLKLPGA